MPNTGNSAAIVFGTQGGTYSYSRIGAQEETIESLDTMPLDAAGFIESYAADLAATGEIELELYHDAETALPGLGNANAAETITITRPLEVTGQTAATYAGSGFVTKKSYPEYVNNNINMSRITIKFNGITGPTETLETV